MAAEENTMSDITITIPADRAPLVARALREEAKRQSISVGGFEAARDLNAPGDHGQGIADAQEAERYLLDLVHQLVKSSGSAPALGGDQAI
jgi:hypothetical protein